MGFLNDIKKGAKVIGTGIQNTVKDVQNIRTGMHYDKLNAEKERLKRAEMKAELRAVQRKADRLEKHNDSYKSSSGFNYGAPSYGGGFSIGTGVKKKKGGLDGAGFRF